MSFRYISVDFETWNIDPINLGIHHYARNLRILMMAWHIGGDPNPPSLWLPGQPFPQAIRDALAAGAKLIGWNSIQFERIVWRERGVPDHGFPVVDDDVWLDTMHLAAAANLPRGLEACAKAVGALAQKDAAGHTLMLRVTNGNRTPWPPKPEDIARLGEYCIQDVATEEATAARLPSWPGMHPWLAMPAIDRRINDRGVMVDLPLVRGLARAAAIETTRLDGEMAALTGGEVPRTTNIESLKAWLVARGVELPRAEEPSEEGDEDESDDEAAPTAASRKSPWRLRKSDVADLLARDDVPEECRLALGYRVETAKASTRKLRVMMASASADARLRGALILMGAQATGRFSSHGWQAHNLVRDAFAKDWENIARQNGLDPKTDKARAKQVAAQALATAIEIGRTGDPDLMRAMYETERIDLQGRKRIEGVLPWVSRMMRRTITAPAGSVLLNGDFANIQARLPVWLAGQQETVDAFARGEDLYRLQASPVYGIAPELLTSEQRQIGKVMRLFLSFMAGVNAFIPAAMTYGLLIPRTDGQRYVNLFRETNQQLVAYCDANLQAAIWAVQYPNREFPVPPTNYVAWFMQGDCLCLRLPSGRLLRYWQPRLAQGYWPDLTPKKDLELTVLVMKGRAVFRRTLWRGLAIQNLVCAIEADMLCVALCNMHEAGLPVTLHVHDNVAAEVCEDDADRMLPIFKEAMLAQPAWTAGLPVAVDADISARFG